VTILKDETGMSRPSQPQASGIRKHLSANWKRLSIVAAAAIALFAGTTVATALAFSPAPAPSATSEEAVQSSADPSPEDSAPADPAPAALASPSESPSPDTAGECARSVSAAPDVTVTEAGPADVIDYGGESDTDRLPMAIAARPDGTSWLAWTGTDGMIHLGRLDCDDRLTGDVIDIEGIDLQDVQADADGVVVLVTREGDCGPGRLCGGSPSPCATMHMIRFDNDGDQVWERQVANLGDGLDGYDDGARFVWWYQHHGRLASDGENYAAYFGVAITVANGGCVDIHQGDRMQVVDRDGNLVDHADAFEVGCSHSWTTRIAWNPDRDEFGMVCATDNQCRIAVPAYTTVAEGTCDGTLFGGDLVVAGDGGYWTAWSQGGEVRLEHFTDGPSDATVETGADAAHPHLVSYGADRMLLAWEDGDAMTAQVYTDDGGEPVGDAFPIDAVDHAYQAFKAYDDGSAAYPSKDGAAIRIVRVMPLG
jgi:hypothetical protein